MNIQAIAFDLDDTLLRDDRSISDRTVATVREAARRGVRIIPASGRTSTSMRAMLDRLGCAACYISCNGAEVHAPDHELLMQELLSVELAREVAAFAAEEGCYAQTYYGERFYYSTENRYAREYAAYSSLEGEYAGDLTTFIDRPTTKMLMMDEPARIAQLMKKAQARWGGVASVTSSKPHFLEVNPLRATKGNALSWCAERFGFDLRHTAAFGDSLNDVSMLTAAGYGVAMANARPEVLELIPLHCLSNQEDGVADFIEKNVLDS